MADPTNRRCFITVQVGSTSRDPVTNETRQTWSTFKRFWAQMEPVRTNESKVGSGLETMTVWTVRADYFDAKNVTAAHRILYEGRYFEILGTMPDDQYKKDWMCRARETDLTSNG